MGEAIHPEAFIGHVHLTVSDLERSERFYVDVLGFEVVGRYGTGAVFLSAGGYHHHLALNTRAGRGAPRAPMGTTGLYHYAVVYPDRLALAKAVKRCVDAGVQVSDVDDYDVSESVYLDDPDGFGIELSWDRSKATYPWANGQIQYGNRRYPLADLLNILEPVA